MPDLNIAARAHDDGIGFGDRRQRGHPALCRGGGPPERAGRPARSRSKSSPSCGEHGPIARGDGELRGPAEPARPRGLPRRRLQRRRRADARGGHRRRQVVRLPGAGAGLGARQRRAHRRLDQHHQPAGTAGRQGPAAAPARARRRRAPAHVRAAQGMAELSLPRPARDGARPASNRCSRPTSTTNWSTSPRGRGTPTDGTLADLPVPPSSDVWDEVAAEPDLCPRLRCPHFDRCFVFQARRRAAQADVVVVNHHLLAADLAVRRASDNWEEAAVLPAYQRLILDEAHHLEDIAAGPPRACRSRAAGCGACSIAWSGAARDCCPRCSMTLPARRTCSVARRSICCASG